MQGLFSSLADKAQSALNSTSLGRTNSNQPAQDTSGQPSASGGILKSHAFESIHHQLRSIQQQYSSSVTPVQKIITTLKGLALDFDNVSRDAHAHSKELYMWSQNEKEDLKDVTDRLAWITYIEGSLSSTIAKEIDTSRAPMKALRDAENGISGRRNIRAGFENQIARIEHDQRHGMEQKLRELKSQLRKAEEDDEPLEKEIELLKRKAIKEGELMKWNAIREYAEKLSIIAQAATAILPALPDVPSSKERPYNGAQLTASVRATLQQTLDQWQMGDVTFTFREPNAADLSRSDTRSFGITHANELSRIDTAGLHAKPTSLPVTPPASQDQPPPVGSGKAYPPPPTHQVHSVPPLPLSGSRPASNTVTAPYPAPGSTIPLLNPANLNQAPALIPVKPVSSPSPKATDSTEPPVKVQTVAPTVAETGVPKSAGPDGPGPANGSLKDLKNASAVAIPTPQPAGPSNIVNDLPMYGGEAATGVPYENAEEEKRRLERERLLREGGSTHVTEQPKYESAEEEKKRLEREERDRLLVTGGTSNPFGSNPDSKQPPPDGDSELPPYQEF